MVLPDVNIALDAFALASSGDLLDADTIRTTLEQGFSGRFANARVLVLIPDHTRTLPLPQLFTMIVDVLADTSRLDFIVALGTHPPLSQESLNRLVGITDAQRRENYSHVGLFNHAWNDPNVLVDIGTLSEDQVKTIAGEAWHHSLGGDVPVRINKLALEYDQIIILGPTFPHEVVGFSGGAKYLFPGISGPELIHKTHWLGALITTMRIIGIEQTPVREMIHAAAEFVTTPVKLIALTVVEDGLAGMFIGSHIEAFRAAARLSSERHIAWLEQPYERVLSCAPPMYDELWVAGKAMYKLKSVVADGGELIIYAPHLDRVSDTHGEHIYRIGYHVCDYFLKQWDSFKDVPLGVLAHSTHVRGVGKFEDGIEHARIRVTLASKLSRSDCDALNLKYRNPDDIDPGEWANPENAGVLVVPKSGEMLYRVR
jgi:lactate racemase